MSLSINNNVAAAGASRRLSIHYGKLAASARRLSSGLRVSGGSDDAAGLAIREFMRSEIAALQQGARNANDAISMLQVADGALGIIDEKLIRMKELAEQAATGTYDSTQRMMIDSEFQAMTSDDEAKEDLVFWLVGVAGAGIKYYADAPDTPLPVQPEPEMPEDMSQTAAKGVLAVNTQDKAQKAIARINLAIMNKDKVRAHLGALQNRLENTVANLHIQADSLQAAESQISDVDVAKEMTHFVRNQILAQSAVSMLSQANSFPQTIMQLIN